MSTGDNTLTDAKVRIITNSDIRFEGTLYKINASEKTIALKDVTSFGTEDRRAERAVPPSSLVYEYLVFRSVEIKDLIVLKNNGTDPREPESKVVVDNKSALTETRSEKTNAREERGREQTSYSKSGRFDFEEMVNKFDKIERSKDDAKDKYKANKYEENDFFDKISTSVNSTERREIEDFKDKKLSQETFGHMPRHGNSNNNNNNYDRNRDRDRNYGSNNRGGYSNHYSEQRQERGGGGYTSRYNDRQQDRYPGSNYYQGDRRNDGYQNGYQNGYQGGYQKSDRTNKNYQTNDRRQDNRNDYYQPEERGNNQNFKKRPQQKNNEAKFVYVKKED